MTSPFEDIMVRPEDTIGTALRRMDTAGRKVVLVADADERLIGLATDGDIRRCILAGCGLDEPIKTAMNDKPYVVAPAYDHPQLRDTMVSRRIDCVPVIDSSGRVVELIWWTDLVQAEMPVAGRLSCPVVIMAGGQGTRLAPYTHVLPKPLIPLGERPIIDMIMERFAAFGCDDFLVSLMYKADLIKAYLTDSEHEISYFIESEPMGTAGGLQLMQAQLQETFFITNCDILVDADYLDVYDAHVRGGNALTLVVSAKHLTIPYGVCTVEAGGRLASIDEKPTLDFLASTGMYVCEPRVLAHIAAERPSDMTEVIASLVASGETIGVYPVSENAWMDVGQLELLQANMRRFSDPR